jgi:hypothetical protein
MAENFIGAYHLANNPKLSEPARSNSFRFIVTDINNIVRVGYTADDDAKVARIANAQEMLEFSVTKAAIPQFTQTATFINSYS